MMLDLKLNNFRFWTSSEEEPKDQETPPPELPPGLPEQVAEAYNQACFLAQRSPRACGALARYGLQQIIRDFWQLPSEDQGTLVEEFDLIADRISVEAKATIENVRAFGTIDSQFAQDRDLMVDTTVSEARILIALLRLLIQEWYGERRRRQVRLEAMRSFIEQARIQTEPVQQPLEMPNPRPAPRPARKTRKAAETPASRSGSGRRPKQTGSKKAEAR